jgi:hypothetical protein
MDTLPQQIANLRGFAEGGAPPLTPRGLRELGGKLQEILLVGKTRELFTHATAVARAEGIRRLPLEIIAEDYEISGWPWEYMHDDERDLSPRIFIQSHEAFFQSSQLSHVRQLKERSRYWSYWMSLLKIRTSLQARKLLSLTRYLRED